jgi:hypothetical protein
LSHCDIPGFDQGMSLDNAIYELRRQRDEASEAGAVPVGYVSQQAFKQMRAIERVIKMFPSPEPLVAEYPEAIPMAIYAAPPSAPAAEPIPQAVIDALKVWTGSEPSQSALARAVDAWRDPGAVWEHAHVADSPAAESTEPEISRPVGTCMITGPREDVRHILRLLPDSGDEPTAATADARPCTCHHDDNPPAPCARKYALGECRAAADAQCNSVEFDRIKTADAQGDDLDTLFDPGSGNKALRRAVAMGLIEKHEQSNVAQGDERAFADAFKSAFYYPEAADQTSFRKGWQAGIQYALSRQPSAAASVIEADDETLQRVKDAVAEALGDAYDCRRVWSAWNYGTMGPDDFILVAEDDDRVDEIARAALAAAKPTCPHEREPRGCYRIRCQLGNACADAAAKPEGGE